MAERSAKKLNKGWSERPPAFFRIASEHNARWRDLSNELLPLIDDSIWRYNRQWDPALPRQGWKIHVSATILTACDILQRVAKCVSEHHLVFKAPRTLDELAKLNCGLWYGYSQVGKFITVYPSDAEQFREVVLDLDRILPGDVEAPLVPFDLRFRDTGNIYFRYGAFVTSTENPGGSRNSGNLQTAAGEYFEDRRDTPSPPWVEAPFPISGRDDGPRVASPLSTKYFVLRSLSQRGKGGVYEAIHLVNGSVETCIVKEGRRDGETSWDGRDGTDRLRQERRVLDDLNAKKLNAPKVVDSFDEGGNHYVVIEKLGGKTLERLVAERRRRLPLNKALDVGNSLADAIAHIHAAGWVWRDCKPSNIFVMDDGTLRPIDFEGAARIEEPDPLPWNTPNYSPPEINDPGYAGNLESNLAEDLYALGACLYFVLEGRSHTGGSVRHEKEGNILAVSFSRKKIPFGVRSVIERLLSPNPDERPSATEARRVLVAAQPHRIED